ncbi:hypothetical protein D4764_0013240 [Takifugu flavidus]|uniref:Uncharacterized protein n=1 Tax=Takifugu flavidus TaxID=433684 RepID=A0A5C6MGL0_9TELE|nr:hypothetical protein D4764_0013240 [Takifugu flavidus]
MDLKGKRLLNYLTTVCVRKRFHQTYARLQRMRGQQSGCSEDVKEMLLLLLSYFDEKEESMFFHVDDTCLAEEVELGQVPLTPTIIVCGQSCYSSTRYMLSLDRNLVNTNISSFISALWLMFGSYYCFNIHYPSELASTLEFLQSCLEEPLISHGWRRMQTHLRALFNLPYHLRTELLCLHVVWDLRTFTGPADGTGTSTVPGRHQGHKGSPPGLQESQESDSATFTDPADDMETSNKQGR